MHYLIPITMLISCAYLIWYMIREKKQDPLIELTDEQVGIIEDKLKRDKDLIHWWRINGNFNISHYVKYLESCETK